MNKKTKNWIKFSIISFLIVFWIVLLFILDLESIVEYLGLRNVYLIVFVLAVTAGGSSFTAPSFYGVLFASASGGAPIIPLVILAGIGSSFGDFVYLYFGTKSHGVLSDKVRRRLNRFMDKLESRHRVLLSIFIFAYAAFAPFPNDLMTISLGISGYKIRRAIIPIVFGNLVYFYILISIGGFFF